jgi:hypothetical protein
MLQDGMLESGGWIRSEGEVRYNQDVSAGNISTVADTLLLNKHK